MSELDQDSIKQRSEDPRRSGNDRRDVNIQTRRIEDKHYVFREQETGQQAFIVVSGTVQIVKNIDGNDVVLGTVEKGGMFGEMALIDDVQRMASARAAGTVTLKVISRELMNQKINQMDPFARGLIRILSDHVRALADKLDGKAT